MSISIELANSLRPWGSTVCLIVAVVACVRFSSVALLHVHHLYSRSEGDSGGSSGQTLLVGVCTLIFTLYIIQSIYNLTLIVPIAN